MFQWYNLALSSNGEYSISARCGTKYLHLLLTIHLAEKVWCGDLNHWACIASGIQYWASMIFLLIACIKIGYSKMHAYFGKIALAPPWETRLTRHCWAIGIEKERVEKKTSTRWYLNPRLQDHEARLYCWATAREKIMMPGTWSWIQHLLARLSNIGD